MCTRAVQGSVQRVHEFPLFVESGRRPLDGLQDGFLGGSGRGQLGESGFQFGQSRPAGVLFGELGIDLGNPCLDSIHFALDALADLCRAVPVLLPHFQPEDITQDFLAFTGILLGELVSLALQEERSIDKGIVIEPQGLLDPRLCVAGCFFGQRPPAVFVLHLEFQEGALVARQGALDTVGVAFMLEGQSDLGRLYGRMQVDDVTALAARFSEQSPGDRVEQGGFSRAVMTRDAGQVKGTEVEFDGIAIREKSRYA